MQRKLLVCVLTFSKNRKFYNLRYREIWGVLMSYYGRRVKSYAEK